MIIPKIKNFLKKESRKKLFIYVSLLSLICLTSFIFLVNYSIKKSTDEQIFQSTARLNQYQVGLILGAHVHSDGVMSHVFFDRVDTGLKLYQENKIQKILVSGDHLNQGYDEVNTAKDYLIKNGVAEENLFLDHAGIDTYDSLYRAKHIFKVESVIIITQKFHLNRALYIANSLDIKAAGLTADQRTYEHIKKYKSREVLARIKAFLNVICNSKSKYLGDAIPITEDSKKSWD
ncbi:MAG: hypothetical protein GF347_04525 [Candidatus Moranbacteria bacterium]|nr:hypothetical protein [Candidatus Moranbacteria bacterium]